MSMILLGMFFFNNKFVFFCLLLDSWFFLFFCVFLLCHWLHIHVLLF